LLYPSRKRCSRKSPVSSTKPGTGPKCLASNAAEAVGNARQRKSPKKKLALANIERRRVGAKLSDKKKGRAKA
jgi:hypothetical protein